MGYTHYWKNREFTAAEWREFTAITRRVINLSRYRGIKIAGWDGNGRPTLSLEKISFNGRGENSFETFTVNRRSDYDFCKTGRRPYDAAVVATLMAGAAIGAINWSSDGDGEPGAFDAGAALYAKALALHMAACAGSAVRGAA